MEGVNRKPFQGITNIIQFNRHFYIAAVISVGLLIIAESFVPDTIGKLISIVLLLIVLSTFFSLAVSFYAYDCSDLYKLTWLNFLNINAGSLLVNINAGFDETSFLLSKKYPGSQLVVLDFYNPIRHTEVSIKRARKAFSVYPDTKTISTSNVPLKINSADCIFAILSAHEIRNRSERIAFFNELQKSLQNKGKIVVVEHIRDLPNFLAYNIGFFHFFSKHEWKHTFGSAGLNMITEVKITPFISAFILRKNGITC